MMRPSMCPESSEDRIMQVARLLFIPDGPVCVQPAHAAPLLQMLLHAQQWPKEKLHARLSLLPDSHAMASAEYAFDAK